MFKTITTSKQTSFQIPRFWEKCVTRSTTEGFEHCVDIVDVANLNVVEEELDTFFDTFENVFDTNQFSIYKFNGIKEDIELQQVFNFWNVIQMNTLDFWNVSFLTVIEEKVEFFRSLLLQFFVTMQMKS